MLGLCVRADFSEKSLSLVSWALITRGQPPSLFSLLTRSCNSRKTLANDSAENCNCSRHSGLLALFALLYVRASPKKLYKWDRVPTSAATVHMASMLNPLQQFASSFKNSRVTETTIYIKHNITTLKRVCQMIKFRRKCMKFCFKKKVFQQAGIFLNSTREPIQNHSKTSNKQFSAVLSKVR